MERITVEPEADIFLGLIIALITKIFHTFIGYSFVGF